MRIAIVTPFAEPEKGAAVARVNSFKSFFEDQDHHVTVLAPRRILQNSGEVKRYNGIINLLKIISSAKPDILLGTSPPITHNFFLVLACRLLGIPFILDSKDPYTYLAARLKQSHGLKLKIYRLMEILTHRLADRIFVLTPLDKEGLDKEYHFPPNKVHVIRNGAEPDKIFFSSKERRALRKKLSIKDNPVILYAGVVGGKDLDIFLEKAEKTIKKYNARLLFIFTTDKTPFTSKIVESIVENIKSLNLEKTSHIVENIPYEKLYKYFSAADLAISPVPDFWMTNLPTKVFDYLACELPIVAKGPRGGSMDEFFRQYDVGFFSSDWNDFIKKLESAIRNIKSFREKGQRGRKVIELHFSRKTFARKALGIMESLAPSRTSA